MLYLIGLGLKPKHLTLEALDAIKNADQAIIEVYTSFYAQGEIEDLEKLVGKKIHVFERQKMEEGMKSLVFSAKNNNIAVLAFGNPLTATTHLELLLLAKKENVKIQIIEGISVTNTLPRTGLDEYKFGRTITIPALQEKYSPTSFYDQFLANNMLGLHTLCLLDTQDGKKFMSASEGLNILLRIEKKKHKTAIKNSTIVLVSGLGGEKEKIFAGTIKTATKIEFDSFPQSIIVCGKLNEKEKEALRELHGYKA